MAGRNISVTHEALGTTRVMKTCGMMGEVVGKAASICTLQTCTPREVYERYLDELKGLIELPGKARRETVSSEIVIPNDALPLAGKFGPPTGLDPTRLKGVVIDDRDAKQTGKWSSGSGLKGYVAYNYLYAGANTGATISFTYKAAKAGSREIRLAYLAHEHRGDTVPVIVSTKAGEELLKINMKKAPPIDEAFISLGRNLAAGKSVVVTVGTKDAGGNAHADAVQILPAD